jgi:hypothetical protein
MEKSRPTGRRHPLCTCSEWQPDFLGTPPPDRSNCKFRDIAHPVLTGEDLDRLMEALKEGR